MGATGEGDRKRSAVPRWARLTAVFGALLMVLSGSVLVAVEVLLARYEGAVGSADLFGDQAAGVEEPRSDITGPLNILLVGIDPRNPETPPLADAIMIMHIPAELDRAYLFSLPRDLRVEIPRFDKANFRGGTDRLNAAMSYGSQVPGRLPSAARGFELLSATISDYTGIKRFDAGAIIDFNGFQKIVDAMGGVDMYIDENVRSEHRQPDGRHRKGNPNGSGYIGPQAEYKKGPAHLKGWQALDYTRQRYEENGVSGGDYGRQRHQQQFVKAMVGQAFSRDVVTNPLKLDAVLRAAGESLTFSGRGRSVVDFALALRNLRADSITMLKLPGESIGAGENYRGERLQPVAEEFLAAIRTGAVDSFVAEHPDLLNTEK